MVLVIDFYRWVTYLAAPAVYSKGSQKDQVALQYKNTRKGQGNNENNTKRTQNKINEKEDEETKVAEETHSNNNEEEDC